MQNVRFREALGSRDRGAFFFVFGGRYETGRGIVRRKVRVTMTGAKLDWKGTGRYDWRAEWPTGRSDGSRRLVVVKLLVDSKGASIKSKIIFVR